MQTKHTFDMVHDTQVVFRALLDCSANPGRGIDINWIVEKFGDDGIYLALAATLLDSDTTFFMEDNQELCEQIIFLTGSKQAAIEEADFLFLNNHKDIEDVLKTVKQGTHIDPHLSATVFIETNEKPSYVRTIEGPGVKPGGQEVLLTQSQLDWLLKRQELNFEYPCGIELGFIKNNSICIYPRKIRLVK